MGTILNMDRDELKKTVRGRLEEYVAMKTRGYRNKPSSHKYAHPACGSGTHNSSSSDGDLHITGETWFCHACGRGGDIFDFYAEENGLNVKNDFPEILEGLQKELGIYPLIGSGKALSPDNKRDEGLLENDKYHLEKIKEYESQLPGSLGEKYLHDRGFSDEIIKEYHLGFKKTGKETGNVIIPYPGTGYYTERIIGEVKEGFSKYNNLPGEQPIFFIHEKKESEYYFITEGQIDALSLRQVGILNVIASNNHNKLEDFIQRSELHPKGFVFVADRDPEDKRGADGKTPGERLSGNIKQMLENIGFKCLVVYPPEGYKDSNDILQKDPDQLHELTVKWFHEMLDLPEISKPEEKNQDENLQTVNLQSYLTGDGFQKDLDYFKQYKNRKTGFSKIDEYLTLYPGLGALTGATSLGKTSFVVQLADQLAERGETVIYFSLEQTPVEITTKILARRLYARNPFSKINNIDIRNGATSEDLEAVKQAYFEVSSRFNIVRSNFMTTVDDVVSYVKNFIEKTGIRPVVFIDYLQILGAPAESRFDDRQRIDDAVKKLKLLANNQEIFILMISNMARSTYREKLGEDSFKESGLIEYTCDFLFGLQLSVLEDDDFYQTEGSRGGKKETLKYEKQDKIDEASEEMPKQVVFKSMKNRNGKKVFRAFFKYHPDYDYFEEDLKSPYEKLPDGFKNAPSKAPFLTV